jgi:hypothetical protein
MILGKADTPEFVAYLVGDRVGSELLEPAHISMARSARAALPSSYRDAVNIQASRDLSLG